MRTSESIREGWKPADPELLIVAVKRDGSRCEYRDLQVGDVFQALWVERGIFVDPIRTDENFYKEAQDVWAVCLDEAQQGFAGNDGFAIEVDTGSFAEMVAKSLDLKVRH